MTTTTRKSKGCEPFCKSHVHCPGCNSRKFTSTERTGINKCRSCGGLFGRCYRGDCPVILVFTDQPDPQERSRYFDFELLGSRGVERVHGWYDPRNMKVTQIG